MVVLVAVVLLVAGVVVVVTGGRVEDDPADAASSDVVATTVVVELPPTVVLADVSPESQAAIARTKVASTILIRTVCSTSVARITVERRGATDQGRKP
jgi:hypothetical protein